MDKLISKIKEKPELKSLPDSLIETTLKAYLIKNRIKDIQSNKNQK